MKFSKSKIKRTSALLCLGFTGIDRVPRQKQRLSMKAGRCCHGPSRYSSSSNGRWPGSRSFRSFETELFVQGKRNQFYPTNRGAVCWMQKWTNSGTNLFIAIHRGRTYVGGSMYNWERSCFKGAVPAKRFDPTCIHAGTWRN